MLEDLIEYDQDHLAVQEIAEKMLSFHTSSAPMEGRPRSERLQSYHCEKEASLPGCDQQLLR